VALVSICPKLRKVFDVFRSSSLSSNFLFSIENGTDATHHAHHARGLRMASGHLQTVGDSMRGQEVASCLSFHEGWRGSANKARSTREHYS
jgi:hypothetical protein